MKRMHPIMQSANDCFILSPHENRRLFVSVAFFSSKNLAVLEWEEGSEDLGDWIGFSIVKILFDASKFKGVDTGTCDSKEGRRIKKTKTIKIGFID